MLLLLEDYNKEIHGYYDDCDYVLYFDEMHEELARNLARELGYGDFSDFPGPGMSAIRTTLPDMFGSDSDRYLLCHA